MLNLGCTYVAFQCSVATDNLHVNIESRGNWTSVPYFLGHGVDIVMTLAVLFNILPNNINFISCILSEFLVGGKV